MPARKIVVHRKKTVSHRKPMRRPAPKMLPAATTTAIVNKVLVKNGIRPGTPMHKKMFPSLRAFAVKHQKGLRRARTAATHAVAFAAGTAAGHYATKQTDGKSGLTRLRAATWNRIPHLLDPKVQGTTLNGKPLNNRTWFQRLRRVSLENAHKAKKAKEAKKNNA